MKMENDTVKAGAAQDAAESAGSREGATSAAAKPAGDVPEDLAGAYRKLLAEKQDLYDRLLRKQADFDNFRKRTEREKEEFLKLATADLIRALLPALDSFERALKHRNPDVPAEFYKGVETHWTLGARLSTRTSIRPSRA
jgi:molecular chaperone GrpE